MAVLIVFHHAVLLAHQAVPWWWLEKFQVAIEIGRSGICKLHIYNAHVQAGEKRSDLFFRNAVDLYEQCRRNRSPEQMVDPPARAHKVPDSSRERIAICHLEDKYSSRLEHSH